MNVLFIDDASLTTSTRSILLSEERHHCVDVVSSFEAMKDLYAKEKYDIVIIDFSVPYGEACLNRIHEIDPQQKVITLSESSGYSERFGCDYCVDNNRRRRLLKSTQLHELFMMVDNFDYHPCPYYNPEANPHKE